MKSLVMMSAIFFMVVMATEGVNAQKKVHKFVESKVIDIPAEKVWAIVGEDYGAIAYSHPKIISSNYINGTLKAGEGAERVCNFNEKGTKFLKEKMVDYNPEKMSFTNTVYQSGRFPVDPDYTKAVYRVEPLAGGKSKITFEMQYRTKPAFMGSMAKGSFKKLIRDYFISIEHHAKTGEKVTKENFRKIKKLYS
ncbi:SRPBCC family protein [Flagellimonas allohymeniacidonis]|uniref:SRPBCC family protein n=1 Tax=Flagellimonas allohymeniacidonis TaxID=2517819 RepID=A0A4Q8QHV2_9FLAO|nr:SRPBCC family protein [Allomuricauda hymeniacidonis]TAI49544.1 SRPBCC family protein [Allomuricauda hymeniacidonis]